MSSRPAVNQPLAIDLFCGLGGWTEGLLAEGYRVIGFDIEYHEYGEHRYPAQLVIQDVLTLHGSQFRNADLIVASPPCQAYSYRAMPWKRAKALPPPDNTLFDACFRIQHEACEAAGRHIPLVVENVCGAQKWVGRARWHFGSYYLWGDVPALMPITFKGSMKVGATNFHRDRCRGGRKLPDNNSPRRWEDRDIQRLGDATKNNGGSWFNIGSPGQKVTNKNPVHGYGGSFGWDGSQMRRNNSKSPARKAASAMIAKIPFELSRHIARVYKPSAVARAVKAARSGYR